MSSQRERTVAAYLKRLVKKYGGVIFKIKGEGATGVPDYLIGIQHANGTSALYLVETKRPKGGVLSARQEYVQGQFSEIGIKTFITFTNEEVDKFIYEVCFS